MNGLGMAQWVRGYYSSFPANGQTLQPPGKFLAALEAASEEPPPPVPPDRCPECLAVKSVTSPYCPRCRKRLEARHRRQSNPAKCFPFKGRPCRICPARAGGKSGLCRRHYERAWNRHWARARRLKRVCLVLAGMGFNELLSGLGEQSPSPATLDAARRLFEAVAEGRGWIARSPWPTRVAHGTSCPAGQTAP